MAAVIAAGHVISPTISFIMGFSELNVHTISEHRLRMSCLGKEQQREPR